MNKIILNCIVKNEEKVIERMLNSVINIIDYFIIIDTGSTDNTIKIIMDFFSKYNIKGLIKKSVFENFEKNRNEALNLCYSNKDVGNYILLLDADMILETNKFCKDYLTEDCYTIVQEDETFSYRNTRIIKNNSKYYYKGYTHEVLITPPASNLDYQRIRIIDKQDGGCKQNKLERDIKLLKQAINEFPNEIRNYFYIANTYFSLWDLDNAITYYEKRISMGGWSEELWYSYYRLAQIYFAKNDYARAIANALEGYNLNPNRLENIYIIYEFYSSRKLTHVADIFKRILIDKRNVNYDSFLFANKLIYQKIKNEFK